jgi:glycosyltransferase involved in cell wall biosynthesis
VDAIHRAYCVILPSECYENFPMSALEAFSLGKPVIGSNLGGITEIIDDNINGLLFTPGDRDDLAKKIANLLDNPDKTREMGVSAQKKTVDHYNSELYYNRVMGLYTRAIQECP